VLDDVSYCKSPDEDTPALFLKILILARLMIEEEEEAEESLWGDVYTLPEVGLKNIVGWYCEQRGGCEDPPITWEIT
jgi:hypothetical protein